MAAKKNEQEQAQEAAVTEQEQHNAAVLEQDAERRKQIEQADADVATFRAEALADEGVTSVPRNGAVIFDGFSVHVVSGKEADDLHALASGPADAVVTRKYVPVDGRTRRLADGTLLGETSNA